MAYTGNPSTNPVDAARLYVADIDPVTPILQDGDYQFFLSQTGNNPRKAAVQAAQTILFYFSQFVEERVDLLELRGTQTAKNYKQALMMFINDPNYSIALNGAMPFAGGISKSDARANISNEDNLVVDVLRERTATSSDIFPDFYRDNPFETTPFTYSNFTIES